MTSTQTSIRLSPSLFTEKEKTFVQSGNLSASTFRFSSGAYGLSLRNDLGELVMLPYQGQQIWSAQIAGRNLTMKSMFSEPRPGRPYLETYGGFLLHCGFTAMGVPGKDDRHPLHGELPNAEYSEAMVILGEDSKGKYIGLTGTYQHTSAFTCNYVAQPKVRLYSGSSIFNVEMSITNLRQVELEYMYLAHINFKPVDHSRLVYSAPCNPERVKVRRDLPAHIEFPEGYREFIEKMAQDPSGHNIIDPNLPFDPEVVFTLSYDSDDEGWAHSMQVLPDGTADYVAHRPEQLDKVVRWIARPSDQDALGFSMPATAEPEGYSAEKAKGNIKVLPGGTQWRADLQIGTLDQEKTREMEERIAGILGS